MNDRLSQELKRAAADTTDIAQPPLHRLLARAESRRRQHRALLVLGACAGVIAVGGVIWGSVSLSGLMREATPAAPSSSSENDKLTSFTVPTNTWRPGDVGMQAHLVGVLRFTDDRCPYAELEGSGGRVWLAFPADARGAQDSAGKRYITNPEGRMYGVEGKVLDAAGGSIHGDVVTNRCGDTTSSIYGFGVMNTPSEQKIQPR